MALRARPHTAVMALSIRQSVARPPPLATSPSPYASFSFPCPLPLAPCPLPAPPPLASGVRGRRLRPLPTSPKADGAGGGAGKGGRGGGGEVGAGSLPWPAVFDKSGSLALVGAPSGHILVASVPDAALLAAIPGVPSPAGGSSGSTGWAAACIRQLALSRDGRFLLSNCTDRVLRVFSLATSRPQWRGGQRRWRGDQGGEAELGERRRAELGSQSTVSAGAGEQGVARRAGGGRVQTRSVARGKQRAVVAVTCVKEYQDAVNRVHWRSACFSGDGEFVVGGVAARGEHKIHIWNRAFGQLVRILEGPKEALADLVWHPTRKVMASLSGGGSIYLWAQDYRESWSAFAPDFRELEENEDAGEEGGGWEEVDIERVEAPEDAEESKGRGAGRGTGRVGVMGRRVVRRGEEGEGQGSGGAGADSDSEGRGASGRGRRAAAAVRESSRDGGGGQEGGQGGEAGGAGGQERGRGGEEP
ncbi:unnamed protein product [Closterium sp. Naga37s-1]|nr:unnamed protein product [Closterium sp. Naga37s-1]